jgi:hypothetical protein
MSRPATIPPVIRVNAQILPGVDAQGRAGSAETAAAQADSTDVGKHRQEIPATD